jgi:tripartite-type tricarboxylate transporter receptor subunit TctC
LPSPENLTAPRRVVRKTVPLSVQDGRVGRAFIGAALAFLIAFTANARAQNAVEAFYKGKQINIVVGSSAGGGYDAYARLLARHIGSYIPGNPSIVVQNMPGAASNRAAAYVYSVAPKDGTAVGAIFPGTILQPLIGDVQVQHDPSKFIYLGSANSDQYVCYARADAPVKKFEDALTRELILGASNEGATTRDLPALLNEVLGTKFRIVTGYAGSREITLALERGEVQGACGLGWTGITTLHPEWFSRGTVKVLAQLGIKGNVELDRMGVPLAVSFAKAQEDRAVMELVMSQSIFGRPFMMAPEVPTERVAALRKAFQDALQSKALLAEAEKMKLDIELLSGEELQLIVRHLYATPARVVGRARQALAARPGR